MSIHTASISDLTLWTEPLGSVYGSVAEVAVLDIPNLQLIARPGAARRAV